VCFVIQSVTLLDMPDQLFRQKEDAVTSSRTMREDIQALSKHGRSPADMFARGRDGVPLGEKEQLAAEFTSARRWHLAVIAAITVAIFIGIGAALFFLLSPAAPARPEEAPVFLPFPAIQHEEVMFRLGDREGLLAALLQKKKRVAAAQQPAFFAFRLFSLDIVNRIERPATSFEVFQTLRFKPPALLLRAFTPEIYPYVLADALVMIIPITNPQKALEGFLAWEASMARDFSPLLDAEASPLSFEDRVVGNVDARVTPSLSYAIFGGRYAVIAFSFEALRAALEYLAQR